MRQALAAIFPYALIPLINQTLRALTMSYFSDDLTSVRRECIGFVAECDSVLLTTQGSSSDVEIGYTPFVLLNEEFYLYLGQCSDQSGNLIESGHADLMFIEDELTSPNVFSRRSLRFRCEANVVPRGYQYTRTMVAFQEQFGAWMDFMRRIPSYQLFRITPGTGKYINSLAQTFTLHGYQAQSLILTSKEDNVANIEKESILPRHVNEHSG
ncbi:MAG: putative heme iron utilization protein [Granulosicoccus sp.]|jgi:putative heme iron utilization protein